MSCVCSWSRRIVAEQEGSATHSVSQKLLGVSRAADVCVDKVLRDCLASGRHSERAHTCLAGCNR